MTAALDGDLLDSVLDAEVGRDEANDANKTVTKRAHDEGRPPTAEELIHVAAKRNDAERLAGAAVVLWHDAGRPEEIRERVEALMGAPAFIAAMSRDSETEAAFDAITTPEPKPGPPVLPKEFWTARPILEQIRQAARARLAGPDAVFVNTLTRVAAITPHTVKLPAIVGGHVGLTTYAVTTQVPGMGKSVAQSVAADLVPAPPEVHDVPAGSGEGLVECMFDMVDEENPDGKPVKVKRQVRHGLIVTIDEGTSVFEIGQRQGATLHSTIRTAFTDGILGNTNASVERKRIVPAGQYVLGVSLGVQPEKAGPLLDDAEAGTPQRFLWFGAGDPGVTDAIPPWPEFTWSPPTVAELEPYKRIVNHHARHILAVADPIKAEVEDQRLDVLAGRIELDVMDAHTPLVRLKVAALLAILDRRMDVTTDDWRLAGIVVDTSSAVRSYVQGVLSRSAAAKESARTHQLIRRESASEGAARDRALASAAASVARRVDKLGRASQRDVARSVAGKHRKLVTIDEITTRAEADGLIAPDGDYWIPGRRTP